MNFIPPTVINLNSLIPEIHLPFLTITTFLAQHMDFEDLSTPLIRLPPVDGISLSANIGRAQYNTTRWRRVPLSAKNVRLKLTFLVMTQRPRLPSRKAVFSSLVPLGAAWRFLTTQGRTAFVDPYPMRFFPVYPEHVIVLILNTPNNRNLVMTEARRQKTFFEALMSPAKPLVFFGFYHKTPRRTCHTETSADQETLKSVCEVYLLHWYCDNKVPPNERLSSDTSYKATEVSCAGGPNCWNSMQEQSLAICDGGRYTFWTHLKWADQSDTTYMDRHDYLALWKKYAIEFRVLHALIPLLNSSEGTFRHLRHFDEMKEFTLAMDTSYNYDVEEPIFITSEKVSKPESAFRMYVQTFDVPTWSFLGGALVSTAILVAVSIGYRGADRRSSGAQWFGRTFLFLSFLMIDQASVMPSFKFMSLHLRHFNRMLMCSWIVAVIIISNCYKSGIQSSFGYPFPYETEYQNWQDFENFSLYSFYDLKWTFVPEYFAIENWYTGSTQKFVQWEMSGQDKRFGKAGLDFNADPIQHGDFIRDKEKLQDSNGVLLWLQEQQEKAKACKRDTNSTRCKHELKILGLIKLRLDFISVEELEDYVGEAYHQKVNENQGLISVPPSKWNLTFELFDRDFRKPEQSSLRMLYWMTRKPRAVFVVPKEHFPYYWAMFMKLEQTLNETVHFARTGPKKLVVEDIRSKHRASASLTLQGPLFAYPNYANWMLDRMRAFSSSGLLNWFKYWDNIHFSPEKRLPVTVGNSREARRMTMEDKVLLAVFYFLAFGSFVSVCVLAIEWCLFYIENVASF